MSAGNLLSKVLRSSPGVANLWLRPSIPVLARGVETFNMTCFY